MTPEIVNIAACTKWYGRVIGVSDINWQFGGGIVGMLGTNGAGKSTLMKMLVGLVQPSRGSLDVFGRSPFLDPDVRCRIGYAPEHDQMWDGLTAIELVTILAELTGMAKGAAKRAADAALASVGLVEDRDRRVGELSKGARQRVKLATAIAHDPDLCAAVWLHHSMRPWASSSTTPLGEACKAARSSSSCKQYVIEPDSAKLAALRTKQRDAGVDGWPATPAARCLG